MSIFDITQHHFDNDLGGGAMRRTIANWSGFKRKGIWSPTDSAMEAAVDPGDLESGAFVFGEQQARAPMQIYLKNGDDAENATRVHGRRSDSPSDWFEIAANKGGPNFNLGVVPEITRNDKRARFPKLWSSGAVVPRQASLNWFMRKQKLVKVIRINSDNAPKAFQFRLRLPLGWTFEIRPDGSGVVKNGAGVARFRMPRPYAWDSSEGGNVRGPGVGSETYAASLEIDSIGTGPGGNPVYLFTVSVDEALSGVGPFFVDPTTVISGTADIDDTILSITYPNHDIGANTTVQVGDWTVGDLYRGVIRIDTAALPAESIDAFTFYCSRNNQNPQAGAGTVEFFAVDDNNYDWLEGPNAFAIPAGGVASVWSKKIYNTDNWTGGNALSAGFRADATPPTLTMTDDTGAPGRVNYNVSLDTAWVSNWRDAVWQNGGVVLFNGDEGTANKFMEMNSTAAGSDQLYFEIDWSAAVAGGRSHTIASGIGRGLGRGLG